MTFTELEQELLAKGVSPGEIAINMVPSDGQFCIQSDGETVEVFYWERGLSDHRASFKDVAAAMDYFRSLVLSNR